jgi:hypothetical protein
MGRAALLSTQRLDHLLAGPVRHALRRCLRLRDRLGV